jgi:predicted metalloprotease
MEQQADCFAGAWLAHIARGESPEIGFQDSDLKAALNAMIFVRDPPGVTADVDPLAHGSAFDRVGAFEDGFRNGSSQCATYPQSPPQVIQFGYDPTDPRSIGEQENAPLNDPGDQSDIFSIVESGLNAYWPTVVPGAPTPTIGFYTDDPASVCDPVPDSVYSVAFYCPANNTVWVEQNNIASIYNSPELGDFGVAYVVATAWAEAMMDTLGLALTGEERALAADCMVGAFTRTALPVEFNPNRPDPANSPSLSPGDLDEAVSTAILASDDSEDVNENGTAFEKIEAFRLGVLDDYPACQSRFGL